MAQLLIAQPQSMSDNSLDFNNVELINTGEQHSTADLRQQHADDYMVKHLINQCIIIQLNATVHPEAYETVSISQTRPMNLPAVLGGAGAQEVEKG